LYSFLTADARVGVRPLLQIQICSFGVARVLRAPNYLWLEKGSGQK
jgi:hypothetical protein